MIEYRSDVVQSIWQNGLAFVKAGALAEAARSFKTILAIHPGHLDSVHLLAVTFYKGESLVQALSLYRRAVQARPPVPAYHSHFALALLESGQSEAALRRTLTALVLDPAHGDALINHGAALRECGRLDAAALFSLRAIAFQPEASLAFSNLGQVLVQQGFHRESISPLRAAILLDPANPRAYYVFGQSENALGLPTAERSVIRALRLKPEQPSYLSTLAAMHKFTPGDEWLVQLQKAAEDGAGPQKDRRGEVGLTFALGKALDDIGRKEEGFAHLHKANSGKRKLVSYDETVTLPMFDTVREIFSPALIKEKGAAGAASDTPIFIVGMPRSGTTLIEQILASHSEVYGAGELPFFPLLVDTLEGSDALPFPLTVPGATAEKLREVGQAYIGSLKSAFGDRRRVTDKMPGNVVFAGLIHLALPQAKIIQVRRDLVDVCLSCYSLNFAQTLDYTYDLGELGRYAYSTKRFMDHWEKVLPPDRLLSVRYEDFIEDQEGQTRKLLDYCNLPWEEACLSFHQTDRAVVTASVRQVRNPIYKSSVRRWRPAPEILQPLMDGLEGKGVVPVGAGTFWFDILAEKSLETGDFARARRLSRVALINDPADGEAWHALGLAFHFGRENQAAFPCLARAVSLSDSLAHYQNNLGTVRRDLGDLQTAFRDYRAAVCLAPSYADALYNLGNIGRQFDDLRSAELLYRRALCLDPQAAEKWRELGATLVELGQAAEAHQILATALRLSSGDAATHFHMSCAADGLEQDEESRASLLKALAIDPAFHQALISLGTERIEAGDKTGATRLFRRALAIDPGAAGAWYNLASISKFTETSPELSEIRRLSSEIFAGRSSKAKTLMHFTLARIFTDLGEQDKAFEHLADGNRLKRASFHYDAAEQENVVRRIMSVVTQENFSRWSAAAGVASRSIAAPPIFIVGMPRSGTSLVEQILATLPGVVGGGELPALTDAVKAADETFGAYPEILPDDRLLPAYLSAVADGYATATARIAEGAVRLVDKMPGNVLFAGLILLAFPNARIIHCRREALDVCWSCYSKHFTRGHEYSYDLRELGRYYRAYDALAEHWRNTLPPARYREIRYEELVEDQEAESRALVEFCGLPWDEACLDFHRLDRRVKTASHQQVRQPIYKTSVGKWERYKTFLKPLIDALQAPE